MVSNPTIVYLAGWGRSGSTLLCRVLGELGQWLPVGELRSIWDLGVIRNSRCGCGEEFRRCPFWSAVFDHAFGGMDPSLARHMMALSGRLHTWHLLALPDALLKRRLAGAMPGYVDVLHHLYATICELSGARVLVDSSKMPAYAFALEQLPGFDLRIGHLVRDPRACTFSWMKRQKQQPFGRMKSIGPVKNSIQWVQRNQAIRSRWAKDSERYLLIRYEDFVVDPASTVRSIAAFAGDGGAELPFVDSHAVHLGRAHMAAGNPNRFEAGRVAVRDDREWRSGLSARDQATVRFLAQPWLKAYGYSTA